MKNNQAKKERLISLMDYFAQGKKEPFGRLLGISGTAVAKWCKTGDFNVQRILQTFPEVNPHWLRTGEGEMILPAAKEGGIMQTIGSGNSNAYNIVGGDGEELVRLRAENERLKEEVKWLRYMVEKGRKS